MMDEFRKLVIATQVQQTLIEHLLVASWEREAEPLEAAKAFSEGLLNAEAEMNTSTPQDIRLEMTEMFHSIVDSATASLRRRLDQR